MIDCCGGETDGGDAERGGEIPRFPHCQLDCNTMFGEADDAPGPVLLGILLIVSASVLGVRVAQRSR